MPVAYSSFDHRAVAQAERRRDVRLGDQRVDLLERQELRQRRPGARRPQIVGRASVEPPIEDQEPVEAADVRRPCARPIAATARAPSAGGRTPRARRRSSASMAAAVRRGELRQRSQIAGVALERVAGQPALDAQMIEVRVDHGRLCYHSRFVRGSLSMPVRSKWQSLPTEAINPATLAIDKLSAADIVEGMLNEDRKMLAAVHREKERIAVGIEIITQALRQRRPDHLRRRRHERPPRRARIGGDAADLRHHPTTWCRRSWPAARTRCCKPREGVEDNYEEGARSINRLRPTKKDVVIGVSASGMTQFVRGALTRARRAGSKIIFVTCDPADRAADVRRPDDRAGGRPRGHRRLDAAEGRHRDEDRPQHAHHGLDDPHRQDLRQPDGRRADGVGKAPRSRPPDHHDRHRPRATTRRTSC